MSSTFVSHYNQKQDYDIFVTGCRGFVGSILTKKLIAKGYSVKGMSRKPIKNQHNLKFVCTNVFDYQQLVSSLEGTEIAFYLLHSMEGTSKDWKQFSLREKTQAKNFIKAANAVGVKRIIYLGGLVNDSEQLSNHMKSRKTVGEILRSTEIPVTELCASIIIGKKSSSFQMMKYLVERLPLMLCPKWVKSKTQPIAIDDVVDYLIGCMENQDTAGKIFQIGGPDVMTYENFMRFYAKFINKNISIIDLPFLTPRLSSIWVDLVTPISSSLAKPLIDSLKHDSIVRENSISAYIQLRPMSIKEAIEIAQQSTENT